MTTMAVDVAIAGGGACGVMTALRAAENPDLVVAVFEKSTREGCNAAISSGSLAAGGTRFQRAAGIDDTPELHAADILAASRDEAWAPWSARCARRPRASRMARRRPATRSRSAPTCLAPACRSRGCTPTSVASAADG